MPEDLLALARRNATGAGATNVELLQGRIQLHGVIVAAVRPAARTSPVGQSRAHRIGALRPLPERPIG